MKQNAEIWCKAMTVAEAPQRDARETAYLGENCKNLPPPRKTRSLAKSRRFTRGRRGASTLSVGSRVPRDRSRRFHPFRRLSPLGLATSNNTKQGRNTHEKAPDSLVRTGGSRRVRG